MKRKLQNSRVNTKLARYFVMQWLKPITLEGQSVRLEPLGMEHLKDLQIAAADGNLWDLWFTAVPKTEDTASYIQTTLDKQSIGDQLPFAVIDLNTNKAIGSTRFCNIDHQNKRLEIGYTWYAKSYQRTSVNTQCKLLLLEHVFETLKCIAVEFRTNWHNHASRNAIARLGAKQDGVLRQHQRQADGAYRDTVVFSILNSEWKAVKKHLELNLSRHS